MNLGNIINWQRLVLLAAFVFCAAAIAGEDANAGFSDGIDRNAPDFVRVSVVRISPGNHLYSCVGHVALRLECPTFKLDSCYSYESEGAVNHLLRYFAGKLKMGMFQMPTEEFLQLYREEGRGVSQYALNLPPTVEQRLWQHMDELVAKGSEVPYDYIQRGCAKALLNCLREAAAPLVIQGPRIEHTIRECFYNELHATFPWNIFCILCITGTETDVCLDGGTPRELISYLVRATLDGQPLLTAAPIELVPQTSAPDAVFPSPVLAAIFVLLLSFVVVWFRLRVLTALFLSVQFILGCFLLYLVSFSQLPTSSWNWLLVPFNPVVPILWGVVRGGGARIICCGFAALLVVWIVAFSVIPHAVTHPAHQLLAAAYVVLYVFGGRRINFGTRNLSCSKES